MITCNFKRFLAVVMLLFAVFTVQAQFVLNERLFSFEENQVPEVFSSKGSTLAISDRHFKDGQKSLKWDFDKQGELSLQKDLKFQFKDPTGVDLYLSAFIVWVYNETPLDEEVTFQFLKDGKLCTSFPFKIDFKGWRSAWVCYERDMQGTPEEGMNEMRIVAPDKAGTLYIDHLITSSKVDARQQTADWQVPFINKETTNHWLVIYKHSLLKPDIPLVDITEKDKSELQRIEKRFRRMLYTPGKLSSTRLNSLREKFNRYHISYNDGVVTGVPIFLCRAAEAYERMFPYWNKDMLTDLGVEMRQYFNLMKAIAVAYNDAKESEDKKELKDMFLAMYDHITDQGVIYGSCWGNIHHYGYSIRGIYPAYFLMKEVLQAEGKLQQAERTLRWYSIANEVYPKPLVNGIDMDSFNTQTTGRIAGILMMEDTPEKLQYIKSFSRWIDYGCRPAEGLSGSFKRDGAAFHHRNNYPAYAVGGLDGATKMIYLLNRTSFAVSPLAHQTVKKALLTMRFYCNKLHFPLAMSGRHPNGKGKLIPMHYATMAIAGTPDGKNAIDKDMAEAYLRLVDNKPAKKIDDPDYMPKVSDAEERRIMRRLINKGYHPEENPHGNLALGYGCLSVQRRSNWSAVVRGHSRYFWAAEHYLGHNLYGRYLAHGSMQILTAPKNKVVTPTTSGWQEEGFDWNRIPGTTSIHLPLELLKANVLNVDKYSGIEEMLYSDEWFAGGLSQDKKNGNFGMKLHEHDKYNGSHRARKSYHFVDGLIVCLGSNIENSVSDYTTETTIFQLAATNKKAKEYWSSYSGDGNFWLDHINTGYYLPVKGKFERHFPQHSRRQDSGKPTSGDWVSLVIDHGKAPHNGSYEYAVMPQTTRSKMVAFAQKPTYEVVQCDKNAHIVKLPKKHIHSYVLFETPLADLHDGLVQRTDTACLLMVDASTPEVVKLTVAQPDLALYRGASDELFDENGKRVERSIYSRPWIENKSKEIPVTVVLRGKWELLPTSHCNVIEQTDDTTTLRFICSEAASFTVRMKESK